MLTVDSSSLAFVFLLLPSFSFLPSSFTGHWSKMKSATSWRSQAILLTLIALLTLCGVFSVGSLCAPSFAWRQPQTVILSIASTSLIFTLLNRLVALGIDLDYLDDRELSSVSSLCSLRDCPRLM